MIEREKVVKGLECCIANRHNNCPYKSTDEGIDKVTSCTTYLMKDALALLKEQEAVEPIPFHRSDETIFRYECRKCRTKIFKNDLFCRHCGRKVKWDD